MIRANHLRKNDCQTKLVIENTVISTVLIKVQCTSAPVVSYKKLCYKKGNLRVVITHFQEYLLLNR